MFRPFYKQIAFFYSESKQYDLAEKYYLSAGLPIEAFEMYVTVGNCDAAIKTTKENLQQNEIHRLYVASASVR